MNFYFYLDVFIEEIKKILRIKSNWFGEVEFVCMNGECFEMELNIDVVYDEDGCISYFVGVFSDIIFCKSIEKELLKLVNIDLFIELFNWFFY